jgi:hypothetical protein
VIRVGDGPRGETRVKDVARLLSGSAVTLWTNPGSLGYEGVTETAPECAGRRRR